MSVPDLAPDDDDEGRKPIMHFRYVYSESC